MRLLAACCLALAALLLTPLPARAQAQPAEDPAAFEARLVDLAERARERTVLVFGLIGLGSGAVVDHDGTVVTNAHVVAGARYAVIQWADGRSVLARRRGIDYARDLAVLEPAQALPAPVPAFALADARPREGSWVVASGFPGGLRTTPAPTVSVGRVLPGAPAAPNVMGVLDYAEAIRTDVPIFSGNSGGPLFDLEGRLVGINGAVELQSAVSMTIPTPVVRQRLEELQGGRILLPGDRALDPERQPLLRALYRATDAIARQMPERIAEASRQAVAGEDGLVPEDLRRRVKELRPEGLRPEPSDALAEVARTLPRQAALRDMCRFADVPGLVSDGGLHLTPVGHLHAVAKASLLAGRDHVLLRGRAARVLAVAEADDLALLQLPDPHEALSPDAPLRRVGSLAWVRGREGLVAAGVVSVSARSTAATLLAQIQQAGVPEQVEQLLERLEGLVDRIELLEPLESVLEQVRAAIEARRAFASGTPPRSYPQVLSIDAPLPPSAVGAPVLDREGRLIGVSVGVAHHGTSYVVPMVRVRRLFAEHLDGPVRPEQLGSARLY